MEEQNRNYEAELLRQEIKSNVHTVKCYGWFLLAMTVIWGLTMAGFFQVSKLGISICYAIVLVSLIPTVIIYRKREKTQPWHKFFYMAMIVVVCTAITGVITYHAVLVYVMPLIFAVQYRQKKVLWFTYALNSFGVLISMLAGFFYGLCDLNMLLESQHSRAYFLELINEQAQFIPFNEELFLIIVPFGVFPRCLILLVFTIILQYAIASGNEDAYQIAQLTIRMETDARTKAFTKNKFEEMKEKYYPKLASIGVIFWDINNLKQINDAFGHDMGDRAIEHLAHNALKFSSDACRVYRVGGDEFVMVFDEPSNNQLEIIYHNIRETILQDRLNGRVVVNCAGGIAYGQGKAIEAVIKEADTHMYLEKKRLKQQEESFE